MAPGVAATELVRGRVSSPVPEEWCVSPPFGGRGERWPESSWGPGEAAATAKRIHALIMRIFNAKLFRRQPFRCTVH